MVLLALAVLVCLFGAPIGWFFDRPLGLALPAAHAQVVGEEQGDDGYGYDLTVAGDASTR